MLSVLRLALHAVAWPAWEGPDEPFHQARAEAWAARLAGSTEAETVVPAAFVAAVTARPCGPDMVRSFGCSPFDGSGALFNTFRPVPPRGSALPAVNYEAHQPPLWYVVAGFLVLPAKAAGASAEASLLLLRLGSVLAVAWALLGPLRRIARRRGEELLAIVSIVLLLPGGSESLARASNDGLVFLLSALVIERLDREAPGLILPALLAAGTLTKLTFLPVVVLSVVELWRRGARRFAVLAALAASVVVPVQALRGWAWGGTYELNRTVAGLGESAPEAAAGLARSVYTFVKTTFWVGGWSFFRAPFFLVTAFFVLLASAVVLLRPRSPSERLSSHLLALSAAAAGFLVLAVGNRRLFGTWGGLGGWYAWNWLPWLAVASDDLLEYRFPRARPWLLAALVAFVLVSNAAFVVMALRLYG
ncbi:MAG TPA: hypothetical protein VE129_11285 [Thermoanaerobaculia bacterium]|nr:hypothetical protein [Thermoanaerobaculia bacterium]